MANTLPYLQASVVSLSALASKRASADCRTLWLYFHASIAACSGRLERYGWRTATCMPPYLPSHHITIFPSSSYHSSSPRCIKLVSSSQEQEVVKHPDGCCKGQRLSGKVMPYMPMSAA